MGSFAIAYYLGCYGLAIASLAFSFAPGAGRGGPAGAAYAFRGILLSVLAGTVGLSFNYFQALSAASPLAVSAVNFLSLLSIPGCLLFVPRFFDSVRPRASSGMIARASDAALTPRETEVARLLVSGYSYRMIAARLGISQATVKTRVLNAYGKTVAGNKIELLSFAERGAEERP